MLGCSGVPWPAHLPEGEMEAQMGQGKEAQPPGCSRPPLQPLGL